MAVPSEQLGPLLAAATAPRPLWREYLALTKPRVVALMLFTVLVGMLLAMYSLMNSSSRAAKEAGWAMALSRIAE